MVTCQTGPAQYGTDRSTLGSTFDSGHTKFHTNFTLGFPLPFLKGDVGSEVEVA